MSGAKIRELLQLFHDDVLIGVDKRLTKLNPQFAENNERSDNISVTFDGSHFPAPTYMNGKYTVFCYALEGSSVRRFWQVPHDFVFPKCDRKLGWYFWMMGVPYHQENDR